MQLHKNPPLNIVLYEPQIPPNTGNIARLCAATRCHLILLGKLGFDLSDKQLKRAGLDYWQWVSWEHFPDAEAFFVLLFHRKIFISFLCITNDPTQKLIHRRVTICFLAKKHPDYRTNGWNVFRSVVLLCR
jgi:tRNA(Leu) C34 or U34 (ribose-2'-O)-methylase TrmL